jgi:hypothetical protein
VSRCRDVLLCALALCWSLVGCSAPANPAPILVEFMDGAPPLARLERGPSLTPLAIDWAAVNGSASVTAPETVDWTPTSESPAVLVLQTPVAPVRVISLDYAGVDSVGIPRGDGREQFCDMWRGPEPAAELGCAFAERGDRVVVLVRPFQARRYTVVQIAWLASDTREVSASWGFRFSPGDL